MQTISKGLDLTAQAEIEGVRIEKPALDPQRERPIPDGYEMFEGRLQKVANSDRSVWKRFNEYCDRNGNYDNPGQDS